MFARSLFLISYKNKQSDFIDSLIRNWSGWWLSLIYNFMLPAPENKVNGTGGRWEGGVGGASSHSKFWFNQKFNTCTTKLCGADIINQNTIMLLRARNCLIWPGYKKKAHSLKNGCLQLCQQFFYHCFQYLLLLTTTQSRFIIGNKQGVFVFHPRPTKLPYCHFDHDAGGFGFLLLFFL